MSHRKFAQIQSFFLVCSFMLGVLSSVLLFLEEEALGDPTRGSQTSRVSQYLF